jgi:MFS family permease
MFGSMVGGFAFNLVAILTLHAGPPQIALLNACFVVPGMVAGPWVGVLADRVRHRPLMIAADALRALAALTIPVAAITGHLAIWQVYAVAAVVSVLSMLFDVSFRSYLPALLGKEPLVQANSIMQGTGAVTETTGWGIAGVLVQLFSAPMAILVDAASFVVSCISLAMLRGAPDMRTPREQTERRTLHEIVEGAREVRHNPTLRALTLNACLSEITGGPVGVVIMLFFVHGLHLTPGLMGPVFGVGGISALAGSLMCSRAIRRWGIGPALIGSLYLRHLGLLGVILAGGPLPLVVALCVAAQLTDAGWSVGDIATTTIIQTASPDGMTGRIFATYETLRSACMFIGMGLGAILGVALPLLLVFSPVRTMGIEPERKQAVMAV